MHGASEEVGRGGRRRVDLWREFRVVHRPEHHIGTHLGDRQSARSRALHHDDRSWERGWEVGPHDGWGWCWRLPFCV